MSAFYISEISCVYTYCSSKKYWSNGAPRKRHILSYQLSGSYDHYFSFGKLPVTEDSLFFISKYDTYKAEEIEKGTSICVSFCSDRDFSTLLLDCSDKPRIRGLFQKLLQYKNIEIPSNYYMCMAICYEILSTVYRLNETESSIDHPKIRKVHSYMLEHYRDSTLKSCELAAMCGISTKHFTELFKKIYGTTPAQYIIDLRIHAAEELLSTGSYSVSETAEMCGFSDVYYFCKLFKRRLNISPGKFAKE